MNHICMRRLCSTYILYEFV